MNASPLDAEGRCSLCRLGATEYDAAYSFGEYEGTLRRLIHLLKYDGMRPLAAPLGKMLRQAVPRELQLDRIVPVPLHRTRMFERGYNQSDLLARHMSRATLMPVIRVLERCRATEAQAGLTHAQRRRNVAGAFAVLEKRKDLVQGQKVLLVDDVMTTGATVNAAASALRRAGAARITVVTLARVDRRKGFVIAQ